MITGSVAVRYAKSLFGLAKEKGIESKIKDDALFIIDSLEKIPELENILSTPIIKGSKKLSAFKAIFEGKINALSLSFIELVFKNNREESLKNMAIQYLNAYKKDKGIKSVVFTTALKFEDSYIRQIEKIIADHYNSKIELQSKVNSDLIGGFVLQIEDQQYNASVKSKLQQIKQTIVS